MIAALLIAGCNKGAPEGQVVARVNGDEITQSELNVELAAAGVPPAVREKARVGILQQIVERKLLVQAAKKDGIDKDPEYVTLRQRDDELLLAQKLLQRRSQAARQTPSEDQVETYLRDHPAIAEQRQILTLDQIRFAAPTQPEQVRALGQAQTLDELIAILRRLGAQFERNTVRADTATLPDELLAKINGLKPGEPIVVLGGPVLTAAVVTGREAAPASTAVATQIAKQRITGVAVNARLKQESAALRQDAKIDYAKGMAPPAKPAKPAGAPTGS